MKGRINWESGAAADPAAPPLRWDRAALARCFWQQCVPELDRSKHLRL